MYSRTQREKALRLYDKLGHIGMVVRLLGYPSRSCLRRWIDGGDEPPRERKEHVYASARQKLDALVRLREGERAASVAASLGVTEQTVLNWRRKFEEKGAEAIMGKKRDAGTPPGDPGALPDDVEELKELCFRYKFERDLMEEAVKLLGKGPGVDPGDLSNREKTALVDAMRGAYPLGFLVSEVGIAPSTYHYNRRAAAAPDKYAAARRAIREEFEAVRGSRGYRYIHRRLALRGGDAAVGERKVRQIMAEEGLVVAYAGRRRAARYSSYGGEISEAPPNIVRRDFHAEAPNELWLTDITEFGLPGDRRKVYLSAVIDCFDGAVAAWSAGTRPTADLANGSLEEACSTLSEGERPVCHSDRGCHYRWPGWAGICERHGVVRSMSAKGCSPDNAACEGFFGRLKNEFFYHRDWSGVSAEEFIERLGEYLRYYNEDRIKESLGWMSPFEYRKSLGIVP